MNKKISYQNWPESVKIVIALASKNFLIKNFKIPMILGYIVLIVGLIDLVDTVTQNRVFEFTNLLKPLSFILIGLANLVNSNSIKWIANNSSWEDKFLLGKGRFVGREKP